MNGNPKISLVMPCFQQVEFLDEAVRSVFDQQQSGLELLVMDPGSTDGSRARLIELQKEHGDKLILCFEPDKGQSEAINKGFSRARGRVLAWLNSDDRLRHGALNQVLPWLDSEEPRWAYGQAGMIDAAGKPHASFIASYKNWRGRRFSRLKLLTENFIPQMAVFWNRAMWERAGGVDKDRHLDMDYDLWLRFAEVSEPLVVNAVLADFRVHGEAKGSRQTGPQLDDALETARKHAAQLGLAGSLALIVHQFFSWRTRFLYRWIKPN